LGLVGGEVNGEKSSGSVIPGVTAGELGSQKPLSKEEVFDMCSEGGVVTGKHVWQVMGAS
jgi:hypothetical protein